MRRPWFLRRAVLLATVLFAVIIAPFVLVAAFALLSPYASMSIPSSCTNAMSQLPSSRTADVPSVGAGTLLASDATTSVVIVADYGGSSFEATAYVVRTDRQEIVRRLSLTGDAVVAAVLDGIVYLFDDKIGYLLRTSDGTQLSGLFESDNYRGLYTSGGTRYLQTDAEITAVGLTGSVFIHRDVHFAGIAFGCFIPAR